MFPKVREGCARSDRIGAGTVAFLILAGLLFSLPTFATTVKRLGLKEIVGASDTIVEARVESIRSFWQNSQILTEVTVEVSRALKGPRAGRLTFLQVGGRVDAPIPLEMTVPGAPIYRVGDEAYFFLQPGRPGERLVVGLFQGHVPLRRDAQGDFVVSGGSRKSPAQFEEEIRRQMAGQKQDASGGLQ
jgi:hypothetical protein